MVKNDEEYAKIWKLYRSVVVDHANKKIPVKLATPGFHQLHIYIQNKLRTKQGRFVAFIEDKKYVNGFIFNLSMCNFYTV